MVSTDLPFKVPALSSSDASVTALVFTLLYVGSLYLSKQGRIPSAPPSSAPQKDKEDWQKKKEFELNRGRDDPLVIAARLRAACLATVASLFGVWGVVTWCVNTADGLENASAIPSLKSLRPTLALLGLPHTLFPTAFSGFSAADDDFFQRLLKLFNPFPYFLAPVLFAGPLYCATLFPPPTQQQVEEMLTSLTTLRNYIIGPITEELVFRSAILATADLAGASFVTKVFITPLWFGIAHAHHAYEVFHKNGADMRAFRIAAIGSIFQFVYTTLFGWYAAYLFVRTGSIYPSIASHMFCNMMGLPQPGRAMAAYPTQFNMIIVFYIGGIAGFVWKLQQWTTPA